MVDVVVDTLTQAIVSGEMSEGDTLPVEGELCEQLGVSRSVLREAVSVLSYRGLLEVKQGRGTIVRTPRESVPQDAIAMFVEANKVSLEHIMEFRCPIEIEVARLAAIRRGDEHLEAMRDSLAVLASRPTSLDICIDSDTAFHQALVTATGNPVFAITIQPITELLRKSRSLTIKHFGIDVVIEQHTAILEAVKRQDHEAAAELMSCHMGHTLRNLQDLSAHLEDVS
jgi:DNA-binding FadR family transcriptional regulator